MEEEVYQRREAPTTLLEKILEKANNGMDRAGNTLGRIYERISPHPNEPKLFGIYDLTSSEKSKIEKIPYNLKN